MKGLHQIQLLRNPNRDIADFMAVGRERQGFLCWGGFRSWNTSLCGSGRKRKSSLGGKSWMRAQPGADLRHRPL